MLKRNVLLCCLALFCLTFLTVLIGCSDDSTTTTSSTTQLHAVELLDVSDIIETAAPPEYVAASPAPGVTDSFEVWTQGDYPLLEKVFGSNDPQTLYGNIQRFEEFSDIVSNVLQVDDNGNIVPGTRIDSVDIDMDGETVTIHYQATVSALAEPTPIPTAYQGVLGTSIDMEYLLDVTTDEMTNGHAAFAITINDSVQAMLKWDENMGDPEDNESSLVYSSVDPRDSTFMFLGVGYVLHSNNDNFTYAFDISSEQNSDFTYRMSWYSNGADGPGEEILNSIIGGGNKDTEFALSYRMFNPADTTVADTTWMLDQVFGPNYSEGTGLISTYSQYLDSTLIVTYDEVPHAMIDNPFEQ